MGRSPTLLALAAVIAGGCAQLFGLDSPELAMPDAPQQGKDSDGDGVIDDNDNCPMLANPDQLDVDHNEVGDACEGCATLPLRASDDDDKDMVDDVADTCIGQSGGTTDADGDGIGIACDPRVGVDARYCVWTFRNPVAPEATDVWPTIWALTGAFYIKDSVLSHPMVAPQQLGTAATMYAAFEAPSGIAIDTRLHLTNYTAPMSINFDLEVDPSVPTPTAYSCKVNQPATGAGKLQLLRGGTVLDEYAFPVQLPMSISAFARLSLVQVPGALQVRCVIDTGAFGVITVTADDANPPSPLRVRPKLVVDHAEVVYDHVTIYKLGTPAM